MSSLPAVYEGLPHVSPPCCINNCIEQHYSPTTLASRLLQRTDECHSAVIETNEMPRVTSVFSILLLKQFKFMEHKHRKTKFKSSALDLMPSKVPLSFFNLSVAAEALPHSSVAVIYAWELSSLIKQDTLQNTAVNVNTHRTSRLRITRQLLW